jgi:signal transduction histidine kinase/ActR/RegA family two-component response regulator
MSNENALELKRHELVVSPLFNLTFMPSLLLLPDSLHIYRATDAATRVLGYSHDELQQRTLYDLLVEPREQVDAALQQARTQPPFVLTVRRPNREERIIEGIVHPLDDCELLHFSFADLTDLHLPRRALRETSAISPRHTGYAYSRELVCAISRTFGGAHTYIGRLVESQRVQGIVYAFNGEPQEPFEYLLPNTPCENVVASGFCAFPSGVQELFPKDEALRALGAESYLGTPLRDPLGRVIGIAWIVHTKPITPSDAISEIFQLFTTRAAHELLREQTEAETEQLRAQLLQVQKMESIGRMAGGLAHDFNNLLTAVLGYIELAQGALPPNSSAQGFLNNAITAVEKAAGVTRQLMTLARQQPMQRRAVNLNEIVQEAVQIAQTWMPAPIQIQTYLSESLWRTEADPSQLMQVLQNLLLNARDAIPEAGGIVTVETQNIVLNLEYARTHYQVVPGEYVMLMVTDTGVGMKPYVRERIFEPFFTTKPRGQGTGLGLSIVYSIVNQLGGHIWVYTEEGKGTTFKIYLPRAYERMQFPREARPSLAELPRGQERLLVVEDEPGVLEVAAEALRLQGYTVLTASSPAEALQLAQSYPEPIHLLVTDVVMPVMSGRELADYLTRLHPQMRVLYVSGYTENTIVHHGVLETGVHFLPKPYTPAQLIQKVREALDSD